MISGKKLYYEYLHKQSSIVPNIDENIYDKKRIRVRIHISDTIFKIYLYNTITRYKYYITSFYYKIDKENDEIETTLLFTERLNLFQKLYKSTYIPMMRKNKISDII